MSDALSQVFDILPIETTESASAMVVEPVENAIDADFEYTRKNQIDLIETSKAAVMTAMRIASESEQPRAIETLAMMLKTASELNRQLVLQSKDKAEASTAKKGVAATPTIGSAQTVNNIVMTGTMQEMLDQIKQLKNAS